MRSRAIMTGTALLLLSCATAALAEGPYRLQPGDIAEVSVVGAPDLKTRTMIDSQGYLSVPLLPQIKVGGLTIDEARSRVAEQLSHKIVQQHAVDGRDSTIAIAPNTVLLTIAEYRPVYLNGDVTKPGEQAYRPGLTVGQAVALAGGYEIMRFRTENPFLQSADLKREHQTKWLELALANAAIWRLKSELDEATGSLEDMTQAPLPDAVLADIRDNARRQLAEAKGKQSAEVAYLEHAASSSQVEASILQKRQAREDEGVENDRKEAETLDSYVDRGALPIMRLAEVRRLFVLSSTQSLQTSVSLNTVSREHDGYLRQKQRIVEDRRTEALKQLNDEYLKRDAARAALAAVGEKITYVGIIRSRLARGRGAEPSITITHPVADGGGREKATETTIVMPGDTLDISLQSESFDELSMK